MWIYMKNHISLLQSCGLCKLLKTHSSPSQQCRTWSLLVEHSWMRLHSCPCVSLLLPDVILRCALVCPIPLDASMLHLHTIHIWHPAAARYDDDDHWWSLCRWDLVYLRQKTVSLWFTTSLEAASAFDETEQTILLWLSRCQSLS